jgi:hypothetical protein
MRRENGTATTPQASTPQPPGEDRPLILTVFPDQSAQDMARFDVPGWGDLCTALVGDPVTKPAKADLPWLKLASFDGSRSNHNCLRHDDGLEVLYGGECDYDQGDMSFDAAVAALTSAGVESLVITSPSYKPEHPKLRVLFPLETPVTRDDLGTVGLKFTRRHYVKQIAKVLPGTIDNASFTLSQAFVFGRVEGNEYKATRIAGKRIDTISPAPKHEPPKEEKKQRDEGDQFDPLKAFDAIRDGDNFHDGTMRLAASMAARGTPADVILAMLQSAMRGAKNGNADRWQARYDDLERLVRSGIKQFGGKAASGRPEPEMTEEEVEARTLLAAMPDCPPAALHGLVGEFARRAAAVSEAPAQAIYATALSYLSTMFCAPFRVDLGEDYTPAGLSVIVAGPSGKARKGTSHAPVERTLIPGLRRLIEDEIDRHAERGEKIEVRRAAQVEMLDEIKQRQDELHALGTVGPDPFILGWAKELHDNQQSRVEAIRERIEKTIHPPTITSYRRQLVEENQKLADAAKALARAEAYQTHCDAFTADKDAYVKTEEREIATLQRKLTKHHEQLEKDINDPGASRERLPEIFTTLAQPMHTMSSLVSKAGLIERIADPRADSKGNEIGTTDKRLQIAVEEFGGLLSVASREDNDMTAGLREAIDGRTIETAGRTNPAKATKPHVNVVGHVTGVELALRAFNDKGKSSVADDGLLNRMLAVFSIRTKLVPIPTRMEGSEPLIEAIWANVRRAYIALHPAGENHHTPIPLAPSGDEAVRRVYPALTNLQGASSNASKLMRRAEWHMRRIAALLTILDGKAATEAEHVESATALVIYARDSADKLLASYEERARAEDQVKLGEKLLAALPADGSEVRARDLMNKGAKFSRPEIDAALRYLTDICTPPRVAIREVKVGGARSTFIRRAAAGEDANAAGA